MSQGEVRSYSVAYTAVGEMKDSEQGCAESESGWHVTGQEMKGKANMRWKIVGMGLLAERENLMQG